MTFEAMWAELAPVGRSATTGGYRRQPFTPAEAELLAWFEEQCEVRGLRRERDGFGNVVGWWDPPGPPGGDPPERPGGRQDPSGLPRLVDADHGVGALSSVHNPALQQGGGVLTGSHLDSVVEGGAYDGPLGVVSALAAVDVLRDRGVQPQRPVGVAVFREEEGSRFPVACLGSRLATGALPWQRARELRDATGAALGDLVDGDAGSTLLRDVGVFVELHVEQGRDLVHRGAAIGVGERIWPHGRYRFDFVGQADHAGTTRMSDRRDPMLTYAMTALAANKQARLADQRATFGRVEVVPNGTNAVPGRVRAWLDARADEPAALAALLARLERLATERADRDGTQVSVSVESETAEVRFDGVLAARLADLGGWPVIPTAAGHDAGILAAAGLPTAMVFVRNPTGISHAPEEHATTDDCLAGVSALADVLALLSEPASEAPA